MTRKQKRFVEEYMIDLNATQAAIRAGYSAHSAGDTGCELLKNPNVRACVDAEMAERARRTGVNADRVIRELARVGFFKATDAVDMSDATLKESISDDDAAVIASVKVKQTFGDYEGIEREVKFSDKLKALELLGKHLGMFTDKVQVSQVAPVIADDLGGEDGG